MADLSNSNDGLTLTGRITGALSSNRWLLVDAVIIFLICLFGVKLFSGRGNASASPGSSNVSSHNYLPKKQSQIHKSPEFVYNYNPQPKKPTHYRANAAPKSNTNRSWSISQLNQLARFQKRSENSAPTNAGTYTTKKIRVRIAGSSGLSRR